MKEIMDFINGDNSDNNDNGDFNECTCLEKLPLAYSYTPYQELDSVYNYSEGLDNGTVFPELNKPLGVYGNEFGKKEGLLK